MRYNMPKGRVLSEMLQNQTAPREHSVGRVLDVDARLLNVLDFNGFLAPEGSTTAEVIRVYHERESSILHPFRTLDSAKEVKRLKTKWREIRAGRRVYTGADQEAGLLSDCARYLAGKPTEFFDRYAGEITRRSLYPDADELLRLFVSAPNATTVVLSTGTEETFLRRLSDWYGVKSVGPELERVKDEELGEVFTGRFAGSYGNIDPTNELHRTDWAVDQIYALVKRYEPAVLCHYGHSREDWEKTSAARGIDGLCVLDVGLAPPLDVRDRFDIVASTRGELAELLKRVFDVRAR